MKPSGFTLSIGKFGILPSYTVYVNKQYKLLAELKQEYLPYNDYKFRYLPSKNMNNEDIAKIMKETRKEKGMTQSEIAFVLDKTPATVSDIERGKIQISASDLYKIANTLNKPIEYFFGESFESEEIENLVFIIRKQPKEQQKKIVEQTRMLLSLDAFQQMATGKEREMTDQEINEAVNYVIRYADEIEAIYKVTSELKRNIKDAFKPQQ